jgi:hypothetical protein
MLRRTIPSDKGILTHFASNTVSHHSINWITSSSKSTTPQSLLQRPRRRR